MPQGRGKPSGEEKPLHGEKTHYYTIRIVLRLMNINLTISHISGYRTWCNYFIDYILYILDHQYYHLYICNYASDSYI